MTLYQRFALSRADYYHDGFHMFEPQYVNWDPGIAAAAQDYAVQYAASLPSTTQDGNGYDTYRNTTYGAYRVIAGMELPDSCDCPPMQAFVQPDAPVFYNQSSPTFRSSVIRIDGMSRMGIGHVGTANGLHYWAFLFGQ